MWGDFAGSRGSRSAWWRHPLTVSAVLTIVCLPVHTTVPASNLDASWQLGLSLAHLHGITAGKGFLFTDGPLGFLAYPNLVWLPGAILGLLYIAAATFAFYSLVYRGLLTAFPPIGALVLMAGIAVFTVQIAMVPEIGTAALVLWSLTLVRPGVLPDALNRWIAPALGVGAALQLLVKFSTGCALLAAAIVVVVARPQRMKNLGLLAASFIGAFLLFWLASGQSPRDIPDWLRGSARLSAGYSSAMAISAGFQGKRYWLLLFVIGAVLAFGVGLLVRDNRARAVPTVAITTLAAWFFMKEGFTRLDPEHAIIGYLGIGMLIVVLPWPRNYRLIALAGIAVTLVTGVQAAAGGVGYPTGIRNLAAGPGHSLGNVARIVRSTVVPSYRSRELARARQSLEAYYALPGSVAATLQHARVHADPWDIAAVWTYGLDWRPVPVFQSYSAFTSTLDRLNAERLQARNGPDAVIRPQNPYLSIDGRLAAWESPGFMVALTCSYAMTAETTHWQVLERASNACPASHPVGDVVVRPGETARVPRARNPDDVVVATFDYPTSAIDKIATTLFKPLRLPVVDIDGAQDSFIAATASQPHLIRVPEAIGSRKVTNAGLDIRSLSFPNAKGAVTAHFYELSE